MATSTEERTAAPLTPVVAVRVRLRSAVEHYRRQQRLAALALAAVRRAYAQGHPEAAVPALDLLQREAARNGVASVGRMLDEQGIVTDRVGEVDPGVVPRRSFRLVIEGDRNDLIDLERRARTEVADAGRIAAGLEVVNRNVSYVRMVNPPCCARCAILAGRVYRWSDGFLRHPNCDCVHIPTTENNAEDLRTNPDALFRNGHVHGFSQAEEAAIREGADMAQIVNAHRGGIETTSLFRHDVRFTRSGVTRRGSYGAQIQKRFRGGGDASRAGRTVRLTPETIYDIAKDRDDALRLLVRYGYIR